MSWSPVELCSDGRLICILEVDWARRIEILNRISVLVHSCITLKLYKCTTYIIMKAKLFLINVFVFCRCAVDSTTVIFNWASPTFKGFSIDAFTFIGDYDKVSVYNGPLYLSSPLQPMRHLLT